LVEILLPSLYIHILNGDNYVVSFGGIFGYKDQLGSVDNSSGNGERIQIEIACIGMNELGSTTGAFGELPGSFISTIPPAGHRSGIGDSAIPVGDAVNSMNTSLCGGPVLKEIANEVITGSTGRLERFISKVNINAGAVSAPGEIFISEVNSDAAILAILGRVSECTGDELSGVGTGEVFSTVSTAIIRVGHIRNNHRACGKVKGTVDLTTFVIANDAGAKVNTLRLEILNEAGDFSGDSIRLLVHTTGVIDNKDDIESGRSNVSLIKDFHTLRDAVLSKPDILIILKFDSLISNGVDDTDEINEDEAFILSEDAGRGNITGTDGRGILSRSIFRDFGLSGSAINDRDDLNKVGVVLIFAGDKYEGSREDGGQEQQIFNLFHFSPLSLFT